jgi:hypothetical protein
MKTEQQRLVWPFIGAAAGIAVVIGMAVELARWTGPLG